MNRSWAEPIQKIKAPKNFRMVSLLVIGYIDPYRCSQWVALSNLSASSNRHLTMHLAGGPSKQQWRQIWKVWKSKQWLGKYMDIFSSSPSWKKHTFTILLYFYSAIALSFGSNNLQRKLHRKISVWVPSFSRVDSSWAGCFIPHPSVPSVFARRKNDTKDENVSGFDLDGRNAEFAEASLFFAAAQSTDCGLYCILSQKLWKGPTNQIISG